jgi:hypothetical protein
MTDGGFTVVWKQKNKIKIKNLIGTFNHVGHGEKAPLVGDLTLTCG